MAELDGPRLDPASGNAKQLVVFLHGYGADGNDLIEIGRAWQGLLPDAAFVSPHAPNPCGQAPVGREWFPLTFRDPNERWAGVNAAAPDAECLSRRRTGAPQSAALRLGPGRLQPGHHDGTACRPAPRDFAGGDRRLFRHAGTAGRRRPRIISRRDCQQASRAAGAWRSRTRSSRCRPSSTAHKTWRRWKCRPNGIFRPASATASTRKACATAGEFLARQFGGRA